jgi:hypothetical protein
LATKFSQSIPQLMSNEPLLLTPRRPQALNPDFLQKIAKTAKKPTVAPPKPFVLRDLGV